MDGRKFARPRPLWGAESRLAAVGMGTRGAAVVWSQARAVSRGKLCCMDVAAMVLAGV